VRLFLYAILPVPLALVVFVVHHLIGTGSWSLGEPGTFWIITLCCYVAAGGQSVVFAFLMSWLDRREASRRVRCLVSAVAGAVSGATMSGLVRIADNFRIDLTLLDLVVLGASVGPAAVVLVDWLAPRGGRGPRRRQPSVEASLKTRDL